MAADSKDETFVVAHFGDSMGAKWGRHGGGKGEGGGESWFLCLHFRAVGRIVGWPLWDRERVTTGFVTWSKS